MDVVEAAQQFRNRGWSPIPVRFKEKIPLPGWPNYEATEEAIVRDFGRGPVNIGVRLGISSGGLVDLDLDCPEARALAPLLIPATGFRFGRSIARGSHYFYLTDMPLKGQKFLDPITRRSLLELRSSGQQTLVPPSVHPSGEPIEFDDLADNHRPRP